MNLLHTLRSSPECLDNIRNAAESGCPLYEKVIIPLLGFLLMRIYLQHLILDGELVIEPLLKSRNENRKNFLVRKANFFVFVEKKAIKGYF